MAKRTRADVGIMYLPVPWYNRGWIPPLVAHLLWISISIVLLIAGGLLVQVAQTGGVDIAGKVIQPTTPEVALMGIAVLPLTLPLWGFVLYIMSRTSLWNAREKLSAAWLPLWTSFVLGVIPAVTLALKGHDSVGSGLAAAFGLILLGGGFALYRIWRRGAVAAQRAARRVA